MSRRRVSCPDCRESSTGRCRFHRPEVSAYEPRAVASWVPLRFGAGWQWFSLVDVPAERAERANFVITCLDGDWSGFRTLADCLKQTMPARVGHYWIEER